MTIRTSTGFAADLAVTGSMKALMDGGSIKVYDGTEPATADAAEAGSVIWEIKKDDEAEGVEGLVFKDTADGRSLIKPSADTWGGATSSGTATYWRLVKDTDDGMEATDQPRVQGNCGSTAGSDLYMSNTTLAEDTDVLAKTLAAFSMTLPAS